MTRVVLVRLAWMLPILLGVSVVAFALMRALPGDFAQASAGTSELTPAALDTIRRNLGLDRPVWSSTCVGWPGSCAAISATPSSPTSQCSANCFRGWP